MYNGINGFKKGYESGINMKKDGKEDLLVGSYGILNTHENQFCRLMNVCEVNDDRQTKKYTAELLVPKPSAFEVEKAIEKSKRYKSEGTGSNSSRIYSCRRWNIYIFFFN